MIREALRKKTRQWFFELFPEFDPGEECFGNRLVNLNLSLAALRSPIERLTEPPRPPPRVATVVLLMDPKPVEPLPTERVQELLEAGAARPFGPPRIPRFVSSSVLIEPSSLPNRWSTPQETEHSMELPIYWPIPAGSWLVAHGCKLGRVYVGNVHQDCGPHAQFCQLSEEVPQGVRLSIFVRG